MQTAVFGLDLLLLDLRFLANPWKKVLEGCAKILF